MRNIVLPAHCDRAAVGAMLPELVDAIHSDDVLIDGSAVSRAGQSLLQLLLSARASAPTERTLHLKLSEALRDTIRLAGLENELAEEIAA